MAKVGLSKPYYAIYTAAGNAVTYANGGLIGKYTEMSIEVDAADDNILYADNAAAESDKSFAGGTFTMSTSELDAAVMSAILGLRSEAITNPDIDTANPSWKVFDDTQAIPYMGIGGIIKKIVGGTTKWVGFVLEKVQMDIPSVEAVTQGETIEWQTQELSATIMRSDAANHPWYRISSEMDSEADAETAVKAFLSIV